MANSIDIKTFFDRYNETTTVTYPTNQIDAVVGFFKKRGFDDLSANTTSVVLLSQAKVDGINPFKLIDTLKGLTDVQLSSIVTQVLNSNRDKTSKLGYRLEVVDETTESRNILP